VYALSGAVLLTVTLVFVVFLAFAQIHRGGPTWSECVAESGQDWCAVSFGLQ